MPRQIGRKYGPDNRYGCMTVLDPRLEDEFHLYNWPGITFRVHPNCDGLICSDGEIVIQSKNGPANDPWLDFTRDQQDKVLRYLK